MALTAVTQPTGSLSVGGGGGNLSVANPNGVTGYTDPNGTIHLSRDTSTSGGAAGVAPSGGTSYPALNTGAISNTQLALDQLPGLLQAALDAESRNHANTIAGFDAQEGAQRDQYGKSTTTNQLNYDSNFMDSIRSGIQGLGGLINLLRGTGAAGGTAQDMVRDTVGGVTANDIRTGADTQQQNQTSLDNSLSTFLTDLKGKRQGAEDTFSNNNSAIRRDNATQEQDLLGKIAGFYGDAGQTGQANDYLARAGALTPTIASNSRSTVSAYDTTPVNVTAPQITAFSGPTQPNLSAVPQDGQVGSGIFTMARRRDQNTPAAPVGA